LAAPPAPVVRPAQRALAARLAGVGFNLGGHPELAFQGLALLLALAGAGLALVLNLPLVLALLGALGGFMVPRWWLSSQENGRRRALDEALPGGLDVIIGALRVQPALPEALAMAGANLQQSQDQHLSAALLTAASRMRTIGEEPALQELVAHTPSPSLRYVVQLLIIYQRSGGAFIAVLSEKATAVREALSIRQEAQAKASDTKLTMLAIPALLVAVTLFLFQDPQFARVYYQGLGQLVLAVAGCSIVLGHRIVNALLDEI
ncbi:MAG: type II secretion system F family protein, partial [Chloroflexi bacterium]|nr:type II secretion system F family protein [Chloroflexota bacterium]